jgi:hypothetical protein
MAGFASGDEMIRTLIGLELQTRELRGRGEKRSVRQMQIDEATQQAMLAAHGDILNDGSIEDEARALIHSDKQGEVIASEIRALSRRAQRRPTPYALAREWARNKIAAEHGRQALSGRAMQSYERAARLASQAAEKAMLAGDVDETFRQKQAQMLNNALIAEARRRRRRSIPRRPARPPRQARRRSRASIRTISTRSTSCSSKSSSGSAASATSTGRRASRHGRGIRRSRARYRRAALLRRHARATHWTRLSVEQMLGLDETVKQIIHLGRLKQKLIDGQEEREFEAVVGEAVAAAANLPPKPPSDLMEPSFGDRLRAKVAAFDSALLKIETIVDWLDGGNPKACSTASSSSRSRRRRRARPTCSPIIWAS